jgi:hypothetical protein
VKTVGPVIATATRRKAAEILSATGAIALGMGIGFALPAVDSTTASLLISIGILSHGWGMYEKNRIETVGTGTIPCWHSLLYWGCWIGLVVLAVYVAILFLRS